MVQKSVYVDAYPLLLSLDTTTSTNSALYKQVWSCTRRFFTTPSNNATGMEVDEESCPTDFQLKIVDSTLTRCGKCSSWSCSGCVLQNDEQLVTLKHRQTLSVVWSDARKKQMRGDEVKVCCDGDAHDGVKKKKKAIVMMVMVLSC